MKVRRSQPPAARWPNSSAAGKPRAKHVVLWGAWYGSHNVGDQALLLSIARMVRDLAGDVRFTVLTNNKRHVQSYAAAESGCRIEVLQNRPQFHRVARAVATADLLIAGGGVPFFDAPWQLCIFSYLFGIARAFRTPYMTWSTSSQQVHRPAAKRLFRWILNESCAITCRDEETRVMLLDCGVERPVHVTIDPVFRLQPEPAEQGRALLERAGHRIADRPLAALTPRWLRSIDAEADTHYNAKSPEQCRRIIQVFAAVCDRLWELGYQPLFVPMNTVAPDDDRTAARRVMEHSRCGRHCLLIDEAIRPRRAPAVYAACDLAVVARVHGSVTSMLGGCPMMMYSFAPKHAGIMRSMGLESLVLREEEATPRAALEIVDRLVRERDALRARMGLRLAELKEQALLPARIAADLLAAGRKNAQKDSEHVVARHIAGELRSNRIRRAA